MTQRFCFQAMGCPCEVQVDTGEAALAENLAAMAEAEARRIEAAYSRYRPDSVVGQINATAGQWFTPDAETAALFSYADYCFRISGGLFDITSGALRRAWRFDRSDHIPDAAKVAAALADVGWGRVQQDGPRYRLMPGMEIDLGGIAKEYAVDRAIQWVMAQSDLPVMVNFGGDLRVSGPLADGARWRVRIEAVVDDQPHAWLEIARGAITSSGDAHRYVERDGRRYGHILDPRNGMPVAGAPRAITVAARTCLEAGVLSTLAMLQGKGAEDFLSQEGVEAWVTR
jgi:thiamine biosynthesis lipoprotein